MQLDRADATPRLSDLAEIATLSPAHLQRAFRRRYGVSPTEYHRARSFDQLKSALRDGESVSTAVYDAGFGSGSRVYEHSDRLLGMTPASYRAGGVGINIRYTTVTTPLDNCLQRQRSAVSARSHEVTTMPNWNGDCLWNVPKKRTPTWTADVHCLDLAVTIPARLSSPASAPPARRETRHR